MVRYRTVKKREKKIFHWEKKMPENVSTEKDMKVFTSAEEMKEIAHVPLPPPKKK